MSKKIIFLSCLGMIIFIGAVLIFKQNEQRTTLSTPLITQLSIPEKKQPSKSLKEYTDPSGFAFSYPDDLSLTKKAITDDKTYADIQLSSQKVNGSLNLKISDSKYTLMEDWLKQNQVAANLKPKEVKLGDLQALEVQLSDRLILGALDQGIFFNIELPLVDKDFWLPVYDKLLANFSFTSPKATSSQDTADSSDEVIFEGEEVVE